jgi:hypothetical protein
VLQPFEADRVAAPGDDAVEIGGRADIGAVGDIALGRDRLVEAQAGARGIRLGFDLDLDDAERDQRLQLIDPRRDALRGGEAEPGLERGERLLVFVVACRNRGR